MRGTPDPKQPTISTPLRRTLRDSLIEAAQLRHPILVRTAGGRSFTGPVIEVGVDFVGIETTGGPIEVSLFYLESVGLADMDD